MPQLALVDVIRQISILILNLRVLRRTAWAVSAVVWWFDFYNSRVPKKTDDGTRLMEIYLA